MDLKGKRALVAGSTQGIGLASATALASLGADCVLIARNEEKLKQALSTLDTGKGQQHSYLVADFSQPQQLKETVAGFVAANPIHILVNNTGGPPAGPITDANPDNFLSAFEQHLVCNHILATLCMPGMKTAAYGRIINIISTSVKIPLKGLGVSNTIRGAVASWAKTMANELAPFGITVNNVLPGATATGRLETIINNKAAKTGHSQLMGGIVWGISLALLEQTHIDPHTGRVVNANLAEYHVPVNADIGEIDVIVVDEEDPHVNSLGAKGIGEIGITGVGAAIANAVYHATGRRVRDLPITLDKVLA